ncbi:MAG: TIGR04551 family protein [Deltaproteobacteria bacterium]|nr:TIGR04551 family protein [Deltaproteobacteria bacterium]
MRSILLTSIVTLLFAQGQALAQFGAPGASPMGGGGHQASKPSKPKVAEAAKVKPQGPKPIEPRNWVPRRPMQIFSLDGYLRFRADYFHKPHLNLRYIPGGPRPSFPNNPGGVLKNQKDFWNANMRLRLEPTFNVHDTVQVHMTLDIFDNMVMGSTPEGFNILSGDQYVGRIPSSPVNTFSTTQETASQGYNSLEDAFRVKHAWADVLTPLGMIRFGRMPSHWGLGIFANSGRCADEAKWTVSSSISPGRCLDADYGDVADRIMFASRIPGVGLIASIGYDFAASGINTTMTSNYTNQRQGQPFDLYTSDNVHEAFLSIAKINRPDEVRELLAQDKLVVNYGFYGMFRRQKSDYLANTAINPNATIEDHAGNLTGRNAWAIIPDLWFRLNWGQIEIDFEGLIIGGKINNLKDMGRQDALRLLQWGFVLRGQYAFMNNSLRVRVEIGHASGDSNIEASDHRLNYRGLSPLPSNPKAKYNTLFAFDPGYYVDLIFFRQLMGTVYNATYYKPTVEYDVAQNFGLRADAIFSMANDPVATPGNSRWYGIELDADVEYHNLPHGFVAGLAYGVFFPLSALNFPSALFGTYQDAKPAQTVQFRLSVKF